MPELNVLCTVTFPERELGILRTGLTPHRLRLQSERPPLAEIDVIVGQPEVETVHQAEKLRWLHLTSAGFTRYDTPEFRAAARARGLLVTNSSSIFDEPCAEHLLAFMLAQARQLPAAILPNGEDAGAWERSRWNVSCLRQQTAVILGFGAIATRLVALLSPFQMKITAMRRQTQGIEGVTIVRPEDLAGALAEADHVINILPHNAASEHFVSAGVLAQMKRGAIFYNIGRGQTVDQDALVASLHQGHLGAAWLDVTDPEPLPAGHPLWSAPRCYITPHIGGGQIDEIETVVRHFLANFPRFLSGAPLQDRIM